MLVDGHKTIKLGREPELVSLEEFWFRLDVERLNRGNEVMGKEEDIYGSG